MNGLNKSSYHAIHIRVSIIGILSSETDHWSNFAVIEDEQN
jgi:hypothetical protein